ncbi:MAG: tRNA (adenosine(37)-N6)-threonylcarbamoyltransferase complex dimerization subunit type 1 TsaB [Thermoguttaceae bacterium]|nr:tRNA (adenosine(37)-N6)-threonylcarbamoyltransferase complex dimerization subunit type 1 TsaB [Thermoguttaceae bacterium]MDW8036815.1 tRNA (adenosine(37)-N6)-threonylcarbamoyltransferase complex dimerization subunit type 1 TsaB [Thermoguttaceae bacterium]
MIAWIPACTGMTVGSSVVQSHPIRCIRFGDFLGSTVMRLLALETTELLGTVAAWQDNHLVLEVQLPEGQRSAASLVPSIGRLLAQVGWQPQQVDVVGVSIGPGSFTGLRVGLTVAKTFAYCVQAAIIAVNTLEAIAAGVPAQMQPVAIAIDAQRGDAAVAVFGHDADGWPVPLADWQVVPFSEWLETLDPGTWLAGPMLRKYKDPIPKKLQVVPAQYWAPRAAQVARLAARRFQQGHQDDLWRILPLYSRKSHAEEKWEARQKA